ncbi:MAG: membrane protein insertase YidC [Bacteroidales bacterium]|nr:membrane protein insertase YidC [Bacteroidales bacterium]
MIDKKTIVGLLLIFGVFGVWMYITQPSEEERAKMRQKQDSIAAAQIRAEKEAEKTAQVVEQDSGIDIEQLAELAKGDDSLASVAQKQLFDNFGVFSEASANQERKLTIENELLKADLTTLGANIEQVTLKDYLTYQKDSVKFFTKGGNSYGLNLTLGSKILQTKDLNFEVFVNDKPYSEDKTLSVKGNDSLVVSMRLYTNADTLNKDRGYLEYRYTLRGNDYRIGFSIVTNNLNKVIADKGMLEFVWNSKLRMKEKDKSVEVKNSSIYYLLKDEVEYLKENGVDDQKEESGVPIKWISFKQQFFSTALISESGEDFAYAKMQTNTEKFQKDDYLRTMTANINIPFDDEKKTYSYDMSFFFGPNKYSIISDYKIDMEQIIPLGWGFFLLHWINRFVILPVFDFLQSFGWSMGLIIFILTILVKIVLFPLAYKQFASTAKMKVIAPEVQKINEKYPKQEQAMQKQQAIMNLYKRAGIKPMAGCLPMLIQFPILIAMFRFFPASIELRQQSFLWADDLSSYDSIINLPFNIPFYGSHISLFCLLMTVAQLFYTRITMKQQPQNQGMPGMKFMMYFMPVMMMFFFNSQSAALNYYYFVSLCFTFLQMFIIRKTIDDKKVLARLEANSKKPLKKSKWQQRIEAMEKQNQAILAERQKQQQRRK